LIRHEIGESAFDSALKALREAAGYLSPARDAHVKVQALENLIKPRSNRISRPRFQNMRAVLKDESNEQASSFSKDKCAKEVRRILRKQPKAFDALMFKKEGWCVIGPGAKKSYQGARKARETAATDPTPENFHEWRKRVKDVWYNIQLLQPIW